MKTFFLRKENKGRFPTQKLTLPKTHQPRAYFNGVAWIINDPKEDPPNFNTKMPSGYLTAKDNKASFLRSQSRSRSPSPNPRPLSRSQSPLYPDLPGKRKDYSKGKVCKVRPSKMIYIHGLFFWPLQVSQYSQFFSRKKEYEREERKRKETELRKARSQVSFYFV